MKTGRVCMELIRCRGHPNVQLAHPSTLELDRRGRLTPRGDCVACVSCRGGGRCAAKRGLAAMYFAVLALEPPFYAGFRVFGVSPGRPVGERMVVRRSLHPADSVMVAASTPARGVPGEARRLLASSFSRCLVLHVVLDVDAEDVLAGGVVENPEDPGDAE